MLQAMNTGHDGSMSTGHANSPRDMLSRLETMVLMAGVDLPLRAIREQVASAVDLIVQQSRLKDGTRKIVNITEVQGMEGDVIVMQDVFVFEQTGVVEGKIQGRLKPTGIRPKFVEKFEVMGINLPPGLFGFTLLGHGRSTAREPHDARDRRGRRPGDHPDRDRRRDLGWIGHLRPPRALRLAKPDRQEGRGPTGQGAVADLIAQSQALDSLNKVVEQRDFGANLARDIARADLKLKPSEFLLIWAGCIVGVPLACSSCRSFLPALGNPLFLLIGALIGFFIPRFWLNRRKNGRLGAFNKQLPDTITLIANALRAGSSFLQAIELVVRESRPPISTEFGRVIREVNLGLPFDQALENMVRRVRSDDLELMATAISHPAPGRRQPRRDPRLDRVHDPRARPDQGRDPHPDRPAAAVGLRRRLPADRPGRLPVRRRARLHGADVRTTTRGPRPAGRRDHPASSAGS